MPQREWDADRDGDRDSKGRWRRQISKCVAFSHCFSFSGWQRTAGQGTVRKKLCEMKFSSKECKDSKAQKGKRVSGRRGEGSEGKRKNLLPAHSVNYIILSCDFGQRVAVFLLFFFLLHSNEQPHKSQLRRKSSKDPQCIIASVLVWKCKMWPKT